MSADYEVSVTTVTDAGGAQLRVVRHFSDGIIARDPVQLIVYEQDKVVCETPRCLRDLLVRRTGDGGLYVFGLGMFEYPSNRTWLLTGGTLTPIPSLRGYSYALFGSLCGHWLGYAISVFLCSVATLSFVFNCTAAEPRDLGVGWLQYAAVAWVILDLAYGPLSPYLILELSLIVCLPFVRDWEETTLTALVLIGSDVILRLLVLYMFAGMWFRDLRIKHMREAKWRKCKDPQKMLECLLLRSQASERKLRLLSAGCCRRIWHLLPDEPFRTAVETAEKFADGLANSAELSLAREVTSGFYQRTRRPGTAVEPAAREGARVVAETLGKVPWAKVPCALLIGYDAARAAAAASSDPDAGIAGRRAFWCMFENERKEQAALLVDLFGPVPFRPVSIVPAWVTPKVVGLTQAIYDERAFDSLPLLADALEEAGCTSEEILNHCRQVGGHIRGCWVVDLVLGKG